MATCGVVSPTGAHNNLSPPSSRAQSILWRAQHKAPTLSFMPLLRGWGFWGVRGCTGEWDVAGDVGRATCRRWPPTSLRDSPDHLNIGASCCWVDGGVPCWVEVRRAPCWPPSPRLVRALDNVVRPFSGRVATRGKESLPCSLLSASTLGLTAVVTPLRARPPVGLRCHIGHLAEAPLDPPRRTRCTCRLHCVVAVGVGHHPG